MDKSFGHKGTQMEHMCLQMAIFDYEVASHNVSNHICIMQKVSKQQAEGHKLAQHQMSN